MYILGKDASHTVFGRAGTARGVGYRKKACILQYFKLIYEPVAGL